MWGSKREITYLLDESISQSRKIAALEAQLAKLVEDLKDNNTRLSRVSLATGLTDPEIYREKAK